MNSFWTFVRQLSRQKGMLLLTLAFAVLSAIGLGIGILSLAPVLSQILHPVEGQGLAELAVQFNAEGHWLQVPGWIIQFLPSNQFDGVVVVLIFITMLTFFGATCNFLHQYLSQTMTTKAVADIRSDVFERIIHLPLSHVIVKGPSGYISRLVRDAAALQQGLNALLGKSIAQLTKGVAALAVAVLFDWKIVLAAVFVGPILVVVLRKLAKKVRRGSRGSLAAQQDMLRQATEIMHGLRAVKASTAESESKARFDEVNKDVVHHELKMRIARAMSSPILETLAIIVLSLLAAIAAKSIITGSMSFERFILSIGSLAIAGASFRPLASLVNEISAAGAPAQRILEILQDPAESQGDCSMPLPRHAESISFEHVSYAYPGTSEQALGNIDLLVRFGEHVAVVGPNGSGKTTLLSLLPRLLSPASGRICVDGFDLSAVDLKTLRRQIGVVTQDTFMINGTVVENIAFGAGDVTLEQVKNAARLAHASSFINELPLKWDTIIAEGGASLSGGQKQRIAIARALVRNPAILILDEATSQVDAESEVAIRDAIQEAGIDRTVLIIAHRMASVMTADRIVVLDKGSIVDIGTHEELLERCDTYARLTRTQLVPAAES
jgi:subfamily B ATP-binding cassette protein MsbA